MVGAWHEKQAKTSLRGALGSYGCACGIGFSRVRSNELDHRAKRRRQGYVGNHAYRRLSRQTRDEQGYVHGAPELVAEVAKTTRYVDLGPKLADYERAGVLEYVVHAIDPDEIFWFGLEQGVFVQRPIGEDGLYRSTIFPGLWLDPQALLKGDRQRLRAVLDLGCATPEHAAFVARLAQARSAPDSR